VKVTILTIKEAQKEMTENLRIIGSHLLRKETNHSNIFYKIKKINYFFQELRSLSIRDIFSLETDSFLFKKENQGRTQIHQINKSHQAKRTR
jgi:superfamily II DNA helicase RecQ